MADATATSPAKVRKARKAPQPKNFATFVVLFSDGTYVMAEPAELIAKLSHATKETQKPENKDLSFEVRGLSRKIKAVRQKSTGASKFDFSGDSVKVEAGKAKNGGLDIDYGDAAV
jgi:hypothetical protein